MFTFFKEKFTKVYAQFSSKVQELLGRSSVDQATLQELSRLLISADTGLTTTKIIIDTLERELKAGKLTSGEDVKKTLEIQLNSLLITPPPTNPTIILLVGINGSGKTTSAAKLAYRYQQQGKKVLLVAADTFRAAAVEQLTRWSNQLNIPLFAGSLNQDPASVVFEGCKKFAQGNFDHLIIDTAGRLQTKKQLMQELEKIKRTITKQLPLYSLETLLVIDAMLGQNSLQQAKIFHEATQLDGIILTKLDGTGKGGVVFAIAQELKIPVLYISAGEKISQIEPFEAPSYISGLLQ